MKLHVDKKLWGIEEVRGIKGAEFSTAVKFTQLKPGRVFVFPLVSENNEMWQVGKNEFVILSGRELFHVKLQVKSGVEILFRAPACNAKSLFDKSFFYFETTSSSAHIYSVLDHQEIRDVLRNAIDPDVEVTIEKTSAKRPMLIKIEAPYLTAYFLLVAPIEDSSILKATDSIVECDRGSGVPFLCLGLYECSVSQVRSFRDFVKLARERCEEARLAEYYEECGGYLIDGKNAIGIFTQKTYGDNVSYEFSPDDFFSKVAIPKLLLANGLVEVVPKKICSFLGKAVDTPQYSIGLSSDVLIITEHNEDGDSSYALEMYGKTCLGVRQIGTRDFLAIITENPSTLITEIRRILKHDSADKYVWDYLPDSNGNRTSVTPIFCQLTDDIILYENGADDHPGCHHLEMWSISKKQPVNVVDSFYDLCWSTANSYVCHMEKQILVNPIGEDNIGKDPKIMIALRLYRPKEYCDIYALIDPSKKFRVHGKVYNMLADTVISKSKTVRGLVKLFCENEALKSKIPSL